MKLGVCGPVGKDIELDSVGRQFEPYLTARCVVILVASFWCDLGCCSRTVVVNKATANTRLYNSTFQQLDLQVVAFRSFFY